MTATLKEQVVQALSTVEDPDLKQDLVTLGMIQELQVTQGRVRFVLALTTPVCPLQEVLKKACTAAIHTHVRADLAVEIQVTAEVTSTRTDEPILPHVKNIIAIASGKGGVGKSTVATNLAVSLAHHGVAVGLLDADIFGPSIPTMFGCADERPKVIQQGDQKYILPLQKYGVKLVSIGFLTPADSAMVWRGPMASSALRQFLRDVDWGKLDYLLIDLPPGTSDIHLTLVQAVPVTGAVIVTTPQKVALADASRGIAMFQKEQIKVPVLGIIENMAYFSPPNLPEQRYYLFGQEGGKTLAKHYGIPFLGQIPIIERIRSGGDEGEPAVLEQEATAQLIYQLATSLAQQVAIRNAKQVPTHRVMITR